MQRHSLRWGAAPAWLGWWLVVCMLTAWPLCSHAQSPRRVALVIGNAGYADAPLRNPINDANDLSARLKTLGFEVTTLTDRNRSQMTQAIRTFGLAAQGADAALFYFAGHGMQIRGRNYLLPVGQRFNDEAEVEADAVDVGTVLARIEEAGPRVSLLMLDACRTAPVKRSSRNTGRGLARMEAPSGALIAFAAQPGAEAKDGDGRNGVFTKHLLAHIGTPGLQVEQMLKRVRADVERETRREQSPREESSLTAEFYFAEASPPREDRGRLEDEAWALCRAGRNAVPCEDYLAAWPQGRYAALARTRLRELQAVAAPQVPPVTGARPVGQVFRDCAECPELVVVGTGSFVMGSPAGEGGRFDAEGPQRRVTIGRAYALGRYEVTVGEFRRFVAATNHVTDAERNAGGDQGCYARDASDGNWEWRAGRSWKSPGWQQGEREPVVCVSWNDAQAYVQWLSRVTGKTYRLPSEAEWEYAARAGSATSRPWGEEANQACRYANVADQSKSPQGHTWPDKHECNDGHWYTAPVGTYTANGWGLHDMIGNVHEWVQDCYDEKAYGGKAPSDGGAYEVSGCSSRSLRGGSWFDVPRVARSANRSWDAPGFRFSGIGFRLARMLP